jgi:hypothetical protein
VSETRPAHLVGFDQRRTELGTRTGNPGRAAVSRETSQPRCFRNPGAPATACSRMPSKKRTRGDTATVVSRQRGRDPWRDETQERIGSHRRLNPVDRSTDFRFGLKPLKTRPIPPRFSRVTPTPTPRRKQRTTRGIVGTDRAGTPAKSSRRQKRQEGQGVSRDIPAVGRENL